MTRPAFAPKLVSRGALVAAAVIAAVALALWPVPLYNRLGFEFAQAMCVAITLVAGVRAATTARSARRSAARTPAPFPGTALARVGLENLLLLVPPLLVQAVRALVEPACDVRSGLAFYALLAAPAVVYGTGWGFALGLAFRRAVAAFAGWVLLVLAADATWLVVHPPKFTYDPIVGFFPGPLYDTEIPLATPLVVARVDAVLQGLAALALALLAWNGRRLEWRQLGRSLVGERAAVAVLAVPLVAAVVLVQVFAAPLGTRIDRRFIQRTLGGRIDTPHVRMFYDRATLSSQRAAALAAEHEARWAQLEGFFALSPRRRIGSYVYASATQKKRLMGAGETSFEDALHDEFHINAPSDEPHPVLTHEMAHIFAAQIDPWVPVQWKMGIHEGIAVAAEWGDESARLEMTPDEACAAMDSLGLLPDIERVLSAWGFWTQPGARAYTACGSFVRWLVDTRGMPRFHTLWRRGDFTRAYGEPLAVLVEAWRAHLAARPPTATELRRAARLFGAGSIFSVRCAHEVAALARDAAARGAGGDVAGAESLWARVIELDPTDSAAKLEWARTRLRGGDAAGALALARAVAADTTLRGRDRAHRVAGDAAWVKRQPALADSFYAAGAALATGSADARAFEVIRGALADLRLQALLVPALADVGASEAAAVAALAAARRAAPDSPLPPYLLGRRLFNAGDWAAARDELDAALALGGLGPEATFAARDLSARAEVASGNARAGLERLGSLSASPDLPEWRRQALADRAYLARSADRPEAAKPPLD